MQSRKKKQSQNEQQENDNRVRCLECGDFFSVDKFYKSPNEIYQAVGVIPVCKNCISKRFDKLLEQYKDERIATYELSKILNIAFHQTAYQGAVTTAQKLGWKVYSAYFSKLNSFGNQNGYGSCFGNGERLDNENNINPNNLDLNDIEKNIEFTEQDEQVKSDVIRLMGYDPFAGYSIFDLKFLYNELIPYLDEDTLDDTFKLSQIIQLVNNNNQVRKIDLVINNIGSDTDALLSNHGNIKSLTDIKNKIVQNTDKIAKENSISVKNRGDKKGGKSTLGYMMKDLRELGFESAEQDYYDMLKAYGMKQTADISHKSICEILNFDEKDIDDMLKSQRDLIKQLQDKEIEYQEKIRELIVEKCELQKQIN